MRVLIPELADDAAPIAAVLRAQGHDVVAEPLIAAAPVENAAVDLSGAQGFLVTGPAAARALAARIGVRTFPVFADSTLTGNLLRHLGFKRVEAANDPQTLARMIEVQLKPAAGALIHPCMAGAPANVAAILTNLGFAVRPLPLFTLQRIATLSSGLRAALQKGEVTGAVFVTPEAGRAFVSLLQREELTAAAKAMWAIAISSVTAAPLRALAFEQVAVPDAGDESVVGAAVVKAESDRAARAAAEAEQVRRAEEETRLAVERAREEQRQAATREAAARAEQEAAEHRERERQAAEAVAKEVEARRRAAAEREAAERERAEVARREAERVAKAQAELEAAERRKREREAAEAARKEAEAQRRAEAEREAAQRARADVERREAERVAKAQAELEAADRRKRERETAEAALKEAEAQRRAQAEREAAERERADIARREAERSAKAQAELEAAERRKRERETAEAALKEAEAQRRAEAEREAAQRARADVERQEAERIAKADEERRARVAAETRARIEAARVAEAARLKAEAEQAVAEARARAERLRLAGEAREREARERDAHEQAAREREAEVARAARVEAEAAAARVRQAEQAAREKAEREAAEKAERERIAREAAAQQEAERERLRSAEKARRAQEQADAERAVREKAERERIAREVAAQQEAERLRLAENTRIADEPARSDPVPDPVPLRTDPRLSREQDAEERRAAVQAAQRAAVVREEDTADQSNLPIAGIAQHIPADVPDGLLVRISRWLRRDPPPEPAVVLPIVPQTPSAQVLEGVSSATLTPSQKNPDAMDHRPPGSFPAAPPAEPEKSAEESVAIAADESVGESSAELFAPPRGRAARMQAEDAADASARTQRWRGFGDRPGTEIPEPKEEAKEDLPPQEEPIRTPRRRSGTMVAVVIVLIAAAAYLYPRLAHREPQVDTSVPAPSATTADKPVVDRGTPPEARQAPIDPNAVRKDADVRTNTPNAVPSGDAAGSLGSAVGGQAQQLAALTARVATLEAALGNTVRLDELGKRIDGLEHRSADAASVLALSDRVQVLESTARNAIAEQTARVGTVLAVAEWREAMAAGRPFQLELESVKALGARADLALTIDDPRVTSRAASGIATFDQLRERFDETADHVLNAAAVPNGMSGWLARTFERMFAIVTVRRVDGLVEGTTPAAILARAGAHLRDGNLAAALTEMEALQGPAAEAASTWTDEARARVIAERAAGDATAKALAALRTIGTSGATAPAPASSPASTSPEQ